MTPGLIDHLLIAVVAVFYPAYTTIVWYRNLLPRLRVDEAGGRNRFYRDVLVEEWLLAAAVLSWWLVAGRPPSGLGLVGAGGWGFVVGVIVVVLFVAAAGFQLRAVRTSAEAREKIAGQLTGVTRLLVPRDPRERRVSIAVSVTAGICEELLYRAYLMWYLMAWMPGVAALAVSSVVFGLAHVYLGWGGVLRATLLGAVFGGAYLLTDSLWIPVVLHATVDITSMLSGSFTLEDVTADAGP